MMLIDMCMIVAVWCDEGFGEYVGRHLQSRGYTVIRSFPCAVIIDESDDLRIVDLYYRTPQALRIVVHANYASSDDELVDTFSVPSWWKENITYKILCTGFKDNRSITQRIAHRVDQAICATVDVESPDLIIFARRDSHVSICGIDLAQLDLFKREYRVYTNPAMLRSSFASALLSYAGYTGTQRLLDPFCGCGTIPIEAAFIASGKSPYHFQKHLLRIDKSQWITKESFHNILTTLDNESVTKRFPITGSDHLLKRVQASSYNAQIAGVLDQLSVTRIDIDWLDTKLDSASVDMIVTHPPLFAEHTKKQLLKIYRHFFEQAAYILTPKGSITIATNTIELFDELNLSFTIRNTLQVSMGQQSYVIVTLTR